MKRQALTPEQEQVIHHPPGQHARVLAVAGSGKSTTMAYRIKHLVLECDVNPNAIRVLMFNSLARKQFAHHLNQVGLPETYQPAVHTFHSFSFHIINQMIKSGMLPSNMQFWLADKAELIWLTAKRAINSLEKNRQIPAEAIEAEDALNAISLWKGSLIPPDRAGSYTSPHLPLVYQEFESLRLAEFVLTFDDFIPLAIQLLEGNPIARARYCQNTQHLIVDEYQDINYGQQYLIELIAGNQADVMVVGDDDQTIYEWRGARPNYILHDFVQVFKEKPIQDYRLSRSFRFGPLIAQCAANVIACNANRVEKPLVAFQSAKQGYIQIYQGDYGSIKEITEQIQALVHGEGVPPSEIIVLARMYAQLNNLETEFLARKIPYRVDGQEPFFKRQEINNLLDYIRLARDYQKPMSEQIGGWLMNIANKPSRMLSRSLLSKIISAARYRRLSIQQALENAPNDSMLGLSNWQADKLVDLWNALEAIHARLNAADVKAGELLAWMVDLLDYLSYFQDYYGKGEHADEKKYAVMSFIQYVRQLNISPLQLLDHLTRLDTTQGKQEDELIIFTTIFRTKGLEYDYVVIPQCDDNLMPYLKGECTAIYDTKGIIRESKMSSKLENERRLFYVALTRARKGILIGTSSNPSRFLEEIELAKTKAVMQVVQKLASNGQDGTRALYQVLQNRTIQPNLLSNLVFGYLPDLGQDSLAEQLQHQFALPTQSAIVLPEPMLDF